MSRFPSQTIRQHWLKRGPYAAFVAGGEFVAMFFLGSVLSLLNRRPGMKRALACVGLRQS
jgi:hypothetical protein